MLMIGHDYAIKKMPKSDTEPSTTNTEITTENSENSESEEYEHLI